MFELPFGKVPVSIKCFNLEEEKKKKNLYEERYLLSVLNVVLGVQG